MAEHLLAQTGGGQKISETRHTGPRFLKYFNLILIFFIVVVASFPQPGSLLAPESNYEFERLGPWGGDVRSLLISSHDPRRVFLGTSDGQIFKSTDRGVSWSILVPGLGRRELVVDTLVEDPTEPERLYAGGWDVRTDGGGLFETLDGGNRWSIVSPFGSSVAVRDLAISREAPSHRIVGTLNGVYVSSDGGASWRQVGAVSPGFRNVESVAIDPRDPRILYVGTWRLAYRSLDFGETWVLADRGMFFDSHVFSISLNPTQPETLFAGACSGIYRSDDRGGSWTRLKVVPERFSIRTRAVHTGKRGRIYGGTTEGLFVSDDRGRTWSRLTSASLTINAIQIDPEDSNRILIATDDHGVLRSQDGGATWQASNTGFVHRQVSRIVPDPDLEGWFYAGLLSDMQNGGYYHFNSHENRWTSLTSNGSEELPEALCFLPLPDGKGRLVGTAAGIYWQRDRSSPWSKLSGDTGRLVVNDLALDRRGNWIFAATNRGIYRASVQGLEFQKPTRPDFSPEILAVVVAGPDSSLILAGGSLGVIRSQDAGANWEILSSGLPPRCHVEAVAVSPVQSEQLFAGTSMGLYESRNGGRLWSKSGDGRLGVDVPSVIFADPLGRTILAADNTFGGVFLSRDAGESWEKIENDSYRSPTRTLAADPTRRDLFYIGTHSEGVYRLRLSGGIESR